MKKRDIMHRAKRPTAHHKWTDGDECETMRIRDYPCRSLPPLFLPSPFSETFDRDSPPSVPQERRSSFSGHAIPRQKQEEGEERLSKSRHVSDGLKEVKKRSARCITSKLRQNEYSTKPRLTGEQISPLPRAGTKNNSPFPSSPSSGEQVASLSLSPRTRGGDSLDRLQAGTK